MRSEAERETRRFFGGDKSWTFSPKVEMSLAFSSSG